MTADRETLMAMAERVEQATGPDGELLVEAALAIFEFGSAQHYRVVRLVELSAFESAARVLFTINAAGRRIETQETDAGTWVRLTWMQGGLSPSTEGQGRTLPLAYTAASLRALATMETDNG